MRKRTSFFIFICFCFFVSEVLLSSEYDESYVWHSINIEEMGVCVPYYPEGLLFADAVGPPPA